MCIRDSTHTHTHTLFYLIFSSTYSILAFCNYSKTSFIRFALVRFSHFLVFVQVPAKFLYSPCYFISVVRFSFIRFLDLYDQIFKTLEIRTVSYTHLFSSTLLLLKRKRLQVNYPFPLTDLHQN